MIEQRDFASGTSSRSTKLIHGGVRYLEQAFFEMDYGLYKLVKEALHERTHMLRTCAYMNKPLPIMIPISSWWEVPYMWMGVKLYDLIAGKNNGVPPSSFISKEEAVFRFPMLKAENLKGAIIYYDGQMNDARLNLMIALTASQQGVTVANYVQLQHFIKEEDDLRDAHLSEAAPDTPMAPLAAAIPVATVAGVSSSASVGAAGPAGSLSSAWAASPITGAVVKDTLSGRSFTVRAKAVINATGPFADSIRKLDNLQADNLIVPSAGVHLVLPDHFSPADMGLIVPKTKDGRVLFFLPWEGNTLCGTTDGTTLSPEQCILYVFPTHRLAGLECSSY